LFRNPQKRSGSIREHVAAFDVCQGSPCRPHNPGIGTIAGGSAQYARFGPIASGLPIRHRTVHRMVFRDSHPCGKLSANWGTGFLMRISLIVHHLSRQARNRFSEHFSEMPVLRPLGSFPADFCLAVAVYECFSDFALPVFKGSSRLFSYVCRAARFNFFKSAMYRRSPCKFFSRGSTFIKTKPSS
jgi:hypothetical protein